jgi:hypothetical protein
VSAALVHVLEDTWRGFLGANAANCGIADQSLSTTALVNVRSAPLRQTRNHGMLAIASFE